jgi:hypothetical protein
MTTPRLATLIWATLFLSVTSLVVCVPLLSVSGVASASQTRLNVAAQIALAAHVIAIAATVVAIVFYRMRGLWVFLTAIPAIFLPLLAATLIAMCAIYGCPQ